MQIKNYGGLNGISLNLAVGQRGEILLLTGKTLHIDCDNALICKHNTVADALEGADDFLTINEHRNDGGGKGGVVDGPQLQKGCVVKIDHDIIPLSVIPAVLVGYALKLIPFRSVQ